MKFSTPLLLASLVANVALVAIVYTHHTRTPDLPGKAPTAPRPIVQSADPKTAEALRAALASGDIAALQAAGVPAEAARELALGRAFARFAERLRASRAGAGQSQWWQNRPASPGSREQDLQARRELSEAMIAVFGDDFGFGGGNNSQFSFLTPDKRAALRRITQDYDEMIAKFSNGGLQLASDREKLKLLQAERERDIAALLSPAELAEYEMRTSNSAATIRNRYGDAIASEDEFKKLYALQKAFDDRYPPLNGRVTQDAMRERSEAQRQLQADMRAAVGNDAFAALTRAADPDLRSLDSLVSRLNLPTGTTDRIVAEREGYAAESQRISADTSLTAAQRRTQLQELGNRAKAGLASTLGAEAADAYAQRSPWINMLQGGVGFSTSPKDGPMGGALAGGGTGVFPVMPAGPNVAGERQIVSFGIANTDNVTRPLPESSAVFFSGAVAAPGEGPRIMTFDSTVTTPAQPPNAAVAVPPPNAPSPPASTPAPKR